MSLYIYIYTFAIVLSHIPGRIFFSIFAYKLFMVKSKIVNNTRNTYFWVRIRSHIVVV